MKTDYNTIETSLKTLSIGWYSHFQLVPFHQCISRKLPVLSDINFNVFTNESKIEIHGCNTAIDGDEDSFSAVLSSHLFKAGKKKSIVIGHTDFTTPNRGNTTEITKQDYRHGQRAIFYNGKLRYKTRAEGRISVSLIKKIVGS